ncbi:MAG: dynamin family protein, partial [Gammaproteobacteria bacterium]
MSTARCPTSSEVVTMDPPVPRIGAVLYSGSQRNGNGGGRTTMAQSGTTIKQLRERLKQLETHLHKENPVLLQVVQSFRQLDRVAYRLGLLDPNESFATRVPWWPLLSVLGLYSSGKSSFINYYLGLRLQPTGNQAVDDKFTVLCYSTDPNPRVLPGRSLDADPRFPFYQISADIEKVAQGQGRRVDAYLQLKTCASEKLRGKIIIDSPGFDADSQRDATLKLTDHIIDLSDLVIVMFDARHPEPGAMRDTLEHLVTNTMNRADSNKFLYVLNQIDTSAREDNPEKVFAAWQRALANKGLTAGRSYAIYNPDVAMSIEDENLRRRFEEKRDFDFAEIYERIHQVEVDRAYRIIGVLEETAKKIQNEMVPQLQAHRKLWRKRVLQADLIVFGVLGLAAFGLSFYLGYWVDGRFTPPWLPLLQDKVFPWVALSGVVAAIALIHYLIQKALTRGVFRTLEKSIDDERTREFLLKAFHKNTGFLRAFLPSSPTGWGVGARQRISKVILDTGLYVQRLNDQFTDPSGKQPTPTHYAATTAMDN